MKFPTMDEFAQMVADKALDEIEYNGKTLRQWVEIILATDINVATKDGTSLSEVGTDAISRQQAIDALTEYGNGRAVFISVGEAVIRMEQLPPIQPAEPKRGKWVLVCDNNGMHFICNKCGAWRYHQEQKFCGECGAKMEVTT